MLTRVPPPPPPPPPPPRKKKQQLEVNTFLLAIKMRRAMILLFLLLSCCHESQQETQKVDKPFQPQRTREQECPTWFVPWGNQTGDCKCGVQTFFSLVAVKCDEHTKQSMLLSDFCMTYNGSTGVTVVGGCPYNSHKAGYKEKYSKLPQNISHLNEFMCGGLNRTGSLCSHCKEGLGIAVFSYTLHCIACLGSFGGWLLYIFLAVFPTTIFFLIVIVFQIRVTSAPMNAFIFMCQVLLNLANAHSSVLNCMLRTTGSLCGCGSPSGDALDFC